MNRNDILRIEKARQQLVKAHKEMEQILKLLSSEDKLYRVAKTLHQAEADLDTLPNSVVNAIQQVEDAHKCLGRYIQELKHIR